MMLISLPEIASGLPAWEAFLERLDAHPAPDDRSWVSARAEAVDMIAWFRARNPKLPQPPGPY